MREADVFEALRLRRDPEEAPVVDYCCKCGGEIYDTNEAHYDALMAEWTCDDCYYELYDSEPYDDEEDEA